MMSIDQEITVWDSLDEDKVPMIVVTVVLAIASVAMAVVNYLKNNEKLGYAAVAVMVVTAIFCFSAKAFIVADNEMLKALKDYTDLGIGAILAGILFVVSAVAVILPKFLKDKE